MTYHLATAGMTARERAAWWRLHRGDGSGDLSVPYNFMCAGAPEHDRKLSLIVGDDGVLMEARAGEYYNRAICHRRGIGV